MADTRMRRNVTRIFYIFFTSSYTSVAVAVCEEDDSVSRSIPYNLGMSVTIDRLMFT